MCKNLGVSKFTFPTGHVTKKPLTWLVIVIALAIFGGLSAITANIQNGSSAPATLPPNSDSALALEETANFPGGDQLTAIVVFSKEDKTALAPQDLAAVEKSFNAMASTKLPESAMEQLAGYDGNKGIGVAAPVIPLSDEVAQTILTLPGDLNGGGLADAVKEIRAAGKDALPEGMKLEVTGPAGFAADTAAAFDGANFTLLGVSALVVAVLLILTYRSPILWLVPLIVVAVADRAAALFVEFVADKTSLEFDASTSGIMSVLVFGAGTNYALLLISRYREELRQHEDSRKALSIALKSSFEAIISSNLTVVLSLLALVISVVPAYSSLGISLSMGLLIALAFSLFVLPAALSLFGRGLFWPKIPQYDLDHQTKVTESKWYRVAKTVAKRPAAFLIAMVTVLLVLASGLFGAKVGLSTTEQFRTESEAKNGVDTIAQFISPGAASPLTVHADAARADDVTKAINTVEGVSIQGPPQRSNDSSRVSYTVIADAAPATPDSYDQVRALREATKEADSSALVGGQTAETLDTRDGTTRDTKIALPVILGIVFVLLVIILRALLAPVLLLAATTLSALAALGAGALVSEYVFGFPALDISVPLYALIFLVALGIDYTVFLVLRTKEEAKSHGTREGMTRAVGLTGGVITSAGIVLAAVFAVLGVLPLITLGQVGIVVGLGIVIDTFLVRTLVVPALFELFGEKIWWPRKVTERKVSHTVPFKPAEHTSNEPFEH